MRQRKSFGLHGGWEGLINLARSPDPESSSEEESAFSCAGWQPRLAQEETDALTSKRRLVSTWNQPEKVQKAYCNIILARASQKAHLERRFVGLRRTGYLNSHNVPQDKLQQVEDMLPELAARLDVKVSNLGIVPEEIGNVEVQAIAQPLNISPQ
ncbi:hypothetical protein RSOL_220680, partial [Rhizoctonia solani AG-3 Rhs1AP]